MNLLRRPLALSAVLLLAFLIVLCTTALLLAQTAADPSGHWEGTITAPFGDVRVEVDLIRTDRGEVTGTFTSQQVRGLPLTRVSIDGRLVTLRVGALGAFQGILLEDGTSISGDYTVPEGSVPFSLTRTGDAVLAPPPASPAIGKELEGSWSGALDVNGRALRVNVRMSNHADGMSRVTVVSLDEGNLEMPAAIVQSGADLRIDVKATGGIYAATLNAARTALTGTYTVQGTPLALTLRRDPTN